MDENRIGIWGTSFAGGHAFVLGVTDRSSEVRWSRKRPTIDGYAGGSAT